MSNSEIALLVEQEEFVPIFGSVIALEWRDIVFNVSQDDAAFKVMVDMDNRHRLEKMGFNVDEINEILIEVSHYFSRYPGVFEDAKAFFKNEPLTKYKKTFK